MQSNQSTSMANQPVAVFGAYGHTGRFVVAELRNRGCKPILCGRDSGKLQAFGAVHPDLELRVASIDDPASLDRALARAALVINCAGPFLDTGPAVIEAALRARIHYLDVAAEQAAVLDTLQRFAQPARDAEVTIIPAMAFYGGLADLLATAAMADWPAADEIEIAVALDSWLPTLGTRLTGERNTVQRVIVSNSMLTPVADVPTQRTWNFARPFGPQSVVTLPLSEIITIAHHLSVSQIHSYMNLEPLRDLRNPATPAPTAADESGRSAQLFLVEVTVRRNGKLRRAAASGRDIYAITAPLVVEAAARVLSGLDVNSGAFAPGEIFDARDFLNSLGPEWLEVRIS